MIGLKKYVASGDVGNLRIRQNKHGSEIFSQMSPVNAGFFTEGLL